MKKQIIIFIYLVNFYLYSCTMQPNEILIPSYCVKAPDNLTTYHMPYNGLLYLTFDGEKRILLNNHYILMHRNKKNLNLPIVHREIAFYLLEDGIVQMNIYTTFNRNNQEYLKNNEVYFFNLVYNNLQHEKHFERLKEKGVLPIQSLYAVAYKTIQEAQPPEKSMLMIRTPNGPKPLSTFNVNLYDHLIQINRLIEMKNTSFSE